MATTDVEALLKRIIDEPSRPVKTDAFYSPEGDCIFYYADGSPHHAVRVDGLFTIYVSDKEEKVIGFQIKGIKALLMEVLEIGARAKSAVELDCLLLAAISKAAGDPSKIEEPRRLVCYRDAIHVAGSATVSLKEAAEKAERTEREE